MSSLHTALIIHAALMGTVFAFLMPLAALSRFLPFSKSVSHVHAPFQLLNICLVITGVAFGARTIVLHGQSYVGYHPIIGTVIVVLMVVLQPALGLKHHLKFLRTGRSTPFGKLHRWLGRIIYVFGIINGGLGFKYGGSLGTRIAPVWGVSLYSAVSGAVCLVYVGFVIWQQNKRQRLPSKVKEAGESRESTLARGDRKLLMKNPYDET